MKNYCVCIKGKKFLGRTSIVRKGDKFWYEVDKIGDTLGNRQITFHLYDTQSFRYEFGLIDKQFKNHFADIQDFRQEQIDQILSEPPFFQVDRMTFNPKKSILERYGSKETIREIKIDKILECTTSSV